MGIESRKRLKQLILEKERKEKRIILEPKLNKLLKHGSFKFLSVQESEELLLKAESWPKTKWEDGLYFQSKLSEPEPIHAIVHKIFNSIKGERLYLFMYNFNFWLIQIEKTEVESNWKELIDIDGVEIICYNPNNLEFICLEKTESFISGKEKEGRHWIYEITYSNKELMKI